MGIEFDLYKPRNFKCSFKYCKKAFETVEELRIHENGLNEHVECEKCDLPFPSWKALHVHMLDSDQHFACHFCGKETMTAKGLKNHIERLHPKVQIVQCPGCDKSFPKPSLLIAHLESGKCFNPQKQERSITQEDFKDHITRKAVIDNILHNPGYIERFPHHVKPEKTARLASGNHHGEENGGISLLDSLENEKDLRLSGPSITPSNIGHSEKTLNLMDDIPDHATEASLATFLHETDPDAMATIFGDMSVNEDSPQLTSTDIRSKQSANDSISAFSPVMRTSNNTRTQMFREGLAELNKQAGSISHPPPGGATEPSSIVPPSSTQANDFYKRTWNATGENWNAEKFFNQLIKRYECPHPGCDYNCDDPVIFRSHRLQEHQITNHRCPFCLRIFRGISGLTAHVESKGKRCMIRKTEEFPQVMDRITGGFINVSRNDEKDESTCRAARPADFQEDGFW